MRRRNLKVQRGLMPLIRYNLRLPNVLDNGKLAKPILEGGRVLTTTQHLNDSFRKFQYQAYCELEVSVRRLHKHNYDNREWRANL